MSHSKESNLLPKMSAVIVAVMFCGSLPALADQKSEKELKKRIEQLENQVQQLQNMVTQVVNQTATVAAKTDAVAAKTDAVELKADAAVAATADSDDDKQEFNRIRVKVDSMADNQETSGFKDLKISGMIDPTYIVNSARSTAGFNFLGNFNGTGKDVYAYDNSYFGQARLQFDKELEGGTKFKLTFAPSKSVNLTDIIHEASMSVPLTGQNLKLIAGQIPDWSGYEYYFGDQNKFITHNLLFDFTIPSYYTGAGLDYTNGNLELKGLIANMNTTSRLDGDRGAVLAYRGDYSVNEYAGVGFAGVEGEYAGGEDASAQKWLDMIEFDGYYIRGPLTLDGHVAYGQWKNGAFNGGDAQWAGFSTLLAYKFQPRLEGMIRLDYLQNDKNGGGTIDTTFNSLNASGLPVASTDTTAVLGAGDYRNGFGPTAQAAAAYNNDNSISIKGANRSAIALGLNYALQTNIMLKAEYRFDYADLPVFYYQSGSNYKNFNQLLGLSTVLSF